MRCWNLGILRASRAKKRRGRCRATMWLVPVFNELLGPIPGLLSENLVEISSVLRLIDDLRRSRRSDAVLVRRPRHLLTWAHNTCVVPRSRVFCRCRIDHGEMHWITPHISRQDRIRCNALEMRCMAVNDIGVHCRGRIRVGAGSCRVGGFNASSFSSLGSSRSLLSCQVLLGEALLSRLALPVVIAHASSILDDSTTKLSEHRLGSDDCDLTRAIGIWENVLLDQVILLFLRRDDFMKRTIFVEEQIRITIVQHASAFCRQHEQLIAAVRNLECAWSETSSVQGITQAIHFLLAGIVVLPRHVLVVPWPQLVCGMIADGR